MTMFHQISHIIYFSRSYVQKPSKIIIYLTHIQHLILYFFQVFLIKYNCITIRSVIKSKMYYLHLYLYIYHKLDHLLSL